MVAPSNRGFEGIIWIVPPVLISLVLVLLIWLVYVWSRRPAAMAAAGNAAALDPQLQAFRDRARKETEL